MEPHIHKQWDITLQEVLNFLWECGSIENSPQGKKIYLMWYVEGSPLYFDLTFIRSFWNFESVLMKWVNLEPNIQSEVSQKEKNEYHVLMHNMESRKVVLMNLFAG